MTHVRSLAAALAAAVLTGPAAAYAADPPAPPVQAAPDGVGAFQLPDDVKYYSDIGRIFERTPVLGPGGTLDWFVTRQRANDDPRAIGVVSGDPAASGPLAFGSIPGTVELRNGVASTNAVAVDGRSWVIDGALTPRPARTVFRAIRDGAEKPATLRFPKEFTPYEAVPTDRGVRVIGALAIGTTKSGRARSAIGITGPGSTKPVRQYFISSSGAVAALPGGRLAITGVGSGSLPDPIVLVDARGRAKRVADRRKPAAPSFTGRAGVAVIRGGLVLDEVGAQVAKTADLDKSAVVLRSATSGKVLIRRALSSLDFPKAPTCTTPTSQFHAIRLMNGPDGLPVVTLGCGNTREVTYGPYYPGQQPYTQTKTSDDQYVMLGLREDLSVRWWRAASEFGDTPRELWDISDTFYNRCLNAVSAADGRLAVIGCQGEIRTITVPGVGTPKPGKLGSVKRSGKAGALVRITCGGDLGKVCSGTVKVTAGGKPVGAVKYALPARPGAARGELDRYVPISGGGKGKLRATLTPLDG